MEVTSLPTMVIYMDIANSVLQLIGRTPMVRLVRVTEGIPCPVIAKVETKNQMYVLDCYCALVHTIYMCE